MTPRQFEAALRRCRPQLRTSRAGQAARLALVDGLSQRQAQRETGLASVRGVQQAIESIKSKLTAAPP